MKSVISSAAVFVLTSSRQAQMLGMIEMIETFESTKSERRHSSPVLELCRLFKERFRLENFTDGVAVVTSRFNQRDFDQLFSELLPIVDGLFREKGVRDHVFFRFVP